MGKKSVMIYIDEKIAEEAKEIGLNISKICENALKMAIEQLRPLYEKNKAKNVGEEWSGGQDSNLLH